MTAHFLVDAHVHIYPGFDLEASLDAAARNMDLSGNGVSGGVLILTETAQDDVFSRLSGRIGEWEVSPTEEAEAKIANKSGYAPLIIIAGRQLRAKSGLEVHALGTIKYLEDGQNFKASVGSVLAADAICVLPWGFGKWTGGRGKAVANIICTAETELYLSDSAVRPGFGPRPRIFGLGAENDILTLAGSDPLPLAGEVNKIGRYGFQMDGDIEFARPLSSLKDWLATLTTSPMVYGHREGLVGFIGNQVSMQLRKFRK